MATMIQISETVPAEREQGKVWIKPSICQAYIYIGNSFVPFAGGNKTFEYTIPLTIFIRGIDRTSLTRIQSFEKNEYLYEKVDQLTLTIDDKDNTIDITEGEEIVVIKKQNESDTPTIWFSGYIDEIRPSEYFSGSKKFLYNIICYDYSKWLDKSLAVAEYNNKTAYEILNDLINTYATDFYVPYFPGAPVIENIKFNYKSIGECIKSVANICNYAWYVDYEKNLQFFKKSTVYAPYVLSEDINTTGHYKNLTININKSQLRNRIYVRGGTYLSDIFSEEFIADGIRTTFKLAYKPRNPVSVYVDTGSGYVQKTLGVDNQTESADFVVNYTYQTVRNYNYPVLSAGDKIKITYKYEIQVLTQDDDLDSQEYLRKVEGGSGIYQYLITDATITSISTAHSRAIAELKANSLPIIEGSFNTDQDGYSAGQTLLLSLPSWGYDNFEVVIQRVMTKLTSAKNFLYEIRFATVKKSLTEFLSEMHETMMMIPQSLAGLEQESLNSLINTECDDLKNFEEFSFNTYTRNPSTAPYVWGYHDNYQFYWNEGIWG